MIMRYLFLILFFPFLSLAQTSDEELTAMAADGFFEEMLQDESELFVNFTHTEEGWITTTENNPAVLSFYFNDNELNSQSGNLPSLLSNRVDYLLNNRKGQSTDFILQRQENGEWLVSTFEGS